MTRSIAASLARLSLAAALSLALSGAPGVALAVAGNLEECREQCRTVGDCGCTPACAHGACARIVPAVVDDAPGSGMGAMRPRRLLHDEEAPPVPPLLEGVFHPPTR